MTTPTGQTPPPQGPPPLNPHWPAHMQPAPHTPPVASAGPPPVPPKSKLEFWRSNTGVVTGLVILGTLIFIIGGVSQRTGTPASQPLFAVEVTSCDYDSSGSIATIGFTVRNNGQKAADATIDIEYRDKAGNRLDTDTSYVRTLPVGDTARAEESTILDAPADGLTCEITDVR